NIDIEIEIDQRNAQFTGKLNTKALGHPAEGSQDAKAGVTGEPTLTRARSSPATGDVAREGVNDLSAGSSSIDMPDGCPVRDAVLALNLVVGKVGDVYCRPCQLVVRHSIWHIPGEDVAVQPDTGQGLVRYREREPTDGRHVHAKHQSGISGLIF